LTSGVDFGVAGGSRRGVDTGAGWGVEISRCSDLTPGTAGVTFAGSGRGVEAGFGEGKFTGPPCEIGVGVISDFFSWAGIAPGERRVGEGCGKFPEGFAVGEAPNVPEDFAPSRFGGTDFLPPTSALGVVPGVTFAFGGPLPGLTRLGGVRGPAASGGEPVAPGDAVAPEEPLTGPWLLFGRFTIGAGFGRSFGGGFCSATIFLNLSASWGLTPCHPLST
jgi:hypothetical protein